MENSKRALAWVLVLAMVVSFGAGFGGAVLANKLLKKETQETGGQLQEQQEARTVNYVSPDGSVIGTLDPEGNLNITVSGDYTLAEAIADKVMPSVVSVTTVYEASFGSSIYDYFFNWGGGGSPRTQETSCVGTGFIVDEDGYVITNSHVVNDGEYKTIRISLYGGEEVEGKVLWSDSTLDLAVLKIEAEGLKAAELGNSDELKIGSYAAAIGNPLGLTFERSMSQGIISGQNRTITVSNDSYSSGTTMEGLLQTDAAINSGNSGGPLLNSKGQVVGIASAKASDGESMGFAIPINVVKPIIQQIEETGSFERVYLGITAIGIEEQTSVSKEALEQYYGSSTGIYIAGITKGGGAEEAGLKEKDIITAVDGKAVGTMNKMYSLLVNYKSGDIVEVTYLRGGEENTAYVTLMTSAQLEAQPQ